MSLIHCIYILFYHKAYSDFRAGLIDQFIQFRTVDRSYMSIKDQLLNYEDIRQHKAIKKRMT